MYRKGAVPERIRTPPYYRLVRLRTALFHQKGVRQMWGDREERRYLQALPRKRRLPWFAWKLIVRPKVFRGRRIALKRGSP